MYPFYSPRKILFIFFIPEIPIAKSISLFCYIIFDFYKEMRKYTRKRNVILKGSFLLHVARFMIKNDSVYTEFNKANIH